MALPSLVPLRVTRAALPPEDEGYPNYNRLGPVQMAVF